MESRERRWSLRNKARRFVDHTDVPVYAKGEDGEILLDAKNEPIIRTYVAAGDRYLACGVRRQDGNQGAPVKWDGEGTRAGIGNVQACGSVWACPVCAAQIQRERAEELRKVLAWAQTEGHTIVMATMTLRHYQRDTLADLWDAISTGWAGVTRGSQWASEKPEKYQDRLERWESARQAALDHVPGVRMPRGGHAGIRPERRIGDQERYGILGWSRTVEVTHGRHGWHPHVHAVLVIEGTGPESELNAVVAGERMHARWSAALASAGYLSDRDNGGYHLLIGDAAQEAIIEYVTKDQGSDSPLVDADALSREATMGAWKHGRRAGETPFQMLAAIDYDADEKGSAKREARWREFVTASEGRRQMTWSAGLRDLAGLAERARTDEEIAADDRAGEVVLTVDADAWDAGAHALATTIMDVVEVEGVAGLRAFLDRAGIGYTLPAVERMDEWYVEYDDTPVPADESPTLWRD